MKPISNDIKQELYTISPVIANLNNTNVYSIQPDYFSNLAEEIVQFIRATELLEQSRNTTYTAPKEYFNDLTELILQKVKVSEENTSTVQDELMTIAPTLNTLNKSNIYSVPNNYFINSTIAIPTKEKAKIVSFFNVRKVVSYAVAAIFIGVLGFGIVQFIEPKNNTINLSSEVAKASTEDIDSYLKSLPHTDMLSSNYTVDENESLGLFEKTSTDEIKEYLNEQPEMVENNN